MDDRSNYGVGVPEMSWYELDGRPVPLHPGSWSKDQIKYFEQVDPGAPWPYPKEPEQQ